MCIRDSPGGGLHFKQTDGTKKSYFYNASENISQWTVYNGTQLKVTARDGDPGGGRTYIDIKTADSTGAEGEDTGYRMKLYHVADPTGDFQAANKRYVDEAVKVNDKPFGKIKAPGYPFKYADGESNVPAECFQWYGSGSVSNYRLRISATNAAGLLWLQNADFDVSLNEGHRFTIYQVFDDSMWHKTVGTFSRVDYHSATGDVLVYISSIAGATNYSTNSLYYITLSGMF